MQRTQPGDVLAVETHAGRLWSLLILPALIGPAISVALYPSGPARSAFVLVPLLGIPALALLVGSFQYRFLRHGVELRTLGGRLRTIPKRAVLGCSIASGDFHAATESGGAATHALRCGATRLCTWAPPMARFIWGTGIQKGLLGTRMK